jgi:hypothetical protein
LKINPPETRDTSITISGGLPALPGTTITMPVTNGHAVKEQLLEAPKDVVPPAEEPPSEFPTPGEAKAIGPHPLQERHFRPDEPGKNSTNGGGETAT